MNQAQEENVRLSRLRDAAHECRARFGSGEDAFSG
jgi:hypothetical protein